MFTGIVEEIGRVASLTEHSLTLNAAKILKNIEPGASVSVNGACLTVTSFDAQSFTVDIIWKKR